MWAGENRRNALRMESVYAIDPDSILTSVVEALIMVDFVQGAFVSGSSSP